MNFCPRPPIYGLGAQTSNANNLQRHGYCWNGWQRFPQRRFEVGWAVVESGIARGETIFVNDTSLKTERINEILLSYYYLNLLKIELLTEY